MRIILPLILIISACSVDKRSNDNEKAKKFYDSLADNLFLTHIDLKVTSNIDSTKIDFLLRKILN